MSGSGGVVADRLAASLITLVFEATLRSFWRRKTLSRFLRQAGVADAFLGTWCPDESKRDFLDRLFVKLAETPNGQTVIHKMARDIARQDSFPDLNGWEESGRMLKDAREAVLALRRGLESIDDQGRSAQARSQAKLRFREVQEGVRRSSQCLDALSARLGELAQRIGTQQAGYDFQSWFYDAMDFFEIVNRRPYVFGGRQIDGSITVSGTTYLVELKFTREQADATDIDTVLRKVATKADNTMGIVLSMCGYSSTALREASGPRTPLLLLDHRHLYLALGGSTSFSEIVDRVRRHASQTGEAFLSPENFNG